MPRTTRAGTTRQATTRVAEERPMPSLEEEGRFDVPKHLVPKGMVYRWVRETALGMPDPNNLSRRSRRGWKPVPGDRPGHGDLGGSSMFAEEAGNKQNAIRNGGMLLCEMPKRDHDRVLAALRGLNLDSLRAIKESLVEGMPEGTPVFREHNELTRTIARTFKE